MKECHSLPGEAIRFENPENWPAILAKTNDIVAMNAMLYSQSRELTILAEGSGPDEVFNHWSRSQFLRSSQDPDQFDIVINPSDDDGRGYLTEVGLQVTYGHDEPILSAALTGEGTYYHDKVSVEQLDVPAIAEKALDSMLPGLKRTLFSRLIGSRTDAEKAEAEELLDQAIATVNRLLAESEWEDEKKASDVSLVNGFWSISKIRKRTWPGATEDAPAVELIERQRGKASLEPETFIQRILKRPRLMRYQWVDERGYELLINNDEAYSFFHKGVFLRKDAQYENVLAQPLQPEVNLLKALQRLETS